MARGHQKECSDDMECAGYHGMMQVNGIKQRLLIHRVFDTSPFSAFLGYPKCHSDRMASAEEQLPPIDGGIGGTRVQWKDG